MLLPSSKFNNNALDHHDCLECNRYTRFLKLNRGIGCETGNCVFNCYPYYLGKMRKTGERKSQMKKRVNEKG